MTAARRLHTLFNFSTVMVTLAVLAVALVAVARGISVWVAYPAAGVRVAAIGSVLGVVIDPFAGCHTPTPRCSDDRGDLYSLSLLCPLLSVCVCEQRRTRRKVLRAVEAERATEAERLAQQRLQTSLRTIDHGRWC
jgi:uncharacterized protein YqgC (DUF456 family)